MEYGRIYYEVTPNVRSAMSWGNIGDAGDEEKAIWFDFADPLLTCVKLYAAKVQKGDRRYAELKIEQHGRVATVFLDADAVQFWERHHDQPKE